ncbi:hypothetical protein BS47DRAFT_1380805 [Hydnum rufescens UP504]|uniref:Uncharacterized protein n=1 Tax=Hydnum rufescens UP504 TaxID=1448309 RepID=A0A9P6DVU9_9AGAM|nr:hypothetical protein BS47DRAFT_1380805 [Hydnum rufescens UP504]
MGDVPITSFFELLNSSTDEVSNDDYDDYSDDIGWNPHIPQFDENLPFVTPEDEDLDGPNNCEVEEQENALYSHLEWISKSFDDEDWTPKHVMKRKAKGESQPCKKYSTSPVISLKSEWTQQRYRGAMKLQSTLDAKWLRAASAGSSSSPRNVSSHSPSPQLPQSDINICESAPPLSEPLLPDLIQGCTTPLTGEDDDQSDDDEEDELDELFQDISSNSKAGSEVSDWSSLQDGINKILDKQKNKCTLPLCQITQYQFLWQFATLHIKGMKQISASIHIAKSHNDGDGVYFASRIRTLAQHYQKFEQLPIEQQGGLHKGSSYLDDEDMRRVALTWLQSQKAGLLGFRLTRLHKGVYMDSHEHPDVVEYHDKIFLPAMENYEWHMAQYNGENLDRKEPNLQPGEKRIIAQFHDESCFHANEFKKSAWSVQFILGALLLETGTTVLQNKIIIYPGAAGDPWWDTKQLLGQIEWVIPIFEAAHPDCEALFIFDQSSAHASLGPDALHAFDMNKANGGWQRKQKDTIIPSNVPNVAMQGKAQKMTTESGDAKGLDQVLQEHGFNTHGICAKCAPICPFENETCCLARILSKQKDFGNQVSMVEELISRAGHHCLFLPKFHCELNPIEMYWGYAKYRYHEVFKGAFAQAKEATLTSLNSCPLDTICCFINWSWQFMVSTSQGINWEGS